VSEVPEIVSSHRELITYIEARLQSLHFMTFRGRDKLSYCPQKLFESDLVKVCQTTKN